MLTELGEAEPARALGEDTLPRSRRVFGPDYLVTLWVAGALTDALIRLGEAAPARALGQDTLQRCRRVLGRGHPITQYLTQVASNGHALVKDEAQEDHPSRPL